MKLNQLLTVNAIFAIALGIAAALYGPLVLVPFGVPESQGDNVLLYWNVASFARLYGAALLGFGLLIFALRGLVDAISPEGRRGIVFALLLGNGVGLFVAITQQFSIWMASGGWIAIGLYLLFFLGYLYLLLRPAA